MSDVDGLLGVVRGGDLRASLEALRDRLAVELERVADEGFCVHCKRGSSSVAPLAARFESVLVAIDALPAVDVKGTPLDDLAVRRAARPGRGAGSAGGAGA